MSTFFTDLEVELDRLGEGGIDPVTDKGLGLASGGIVGNPRTRDLRFAGLKRAAGGPRVGQTQFPGISGIRGRDIRLAARRRVSRAAPAVVYLAVTMGPRPAGLSAAGLGAPPIAPVSDSGLVAGLGVS